jgi:hypothetical protein
MRKLLFSAVSAAALVAGMPFASAQDLSQPLPFTLKTKPSTSTGASANIPPGTAPASPNNGDLWTTITGLWARINGNSVPIVSGPALSTAGDIATFSGTNGQTVTDSGFSIATMFQQASTGCWETYCVDSVHGSDSNPGTAAAPFQTFAPIGYGSTVTAGQSVGLACGSIWKPTLATANQSPTTNQYVLGVVEASPATYPGNPLTYNTVAAYNYGGSCSALPILDGSAIIPNSAFTAVGGSYPNLYYAGASFTGSGGGPGGTTLTVNSGLAGAIEIGYTLGGNGCVPSGTTILSGSGNSWVASAAIPGCSNVALTALPTFLPENNNMFVWETGAPGDDPTGQFMSLQTSEANANSTAGGYYIPGWTAFEATMPAAGYIYVHPYDGTNAVTNGYTYEYAMQIPLEWNTLYDHITGIEGRKSGSNSGVFDFPNGSAGFTQLSNCIARDTGRHAALLSSGSVVNNCEFVDNYDNESGISGNWLVFHDRTTSGIGQYPLTVTNDVFEQDQVIANNGASGALGVYSHTDDTSSMGPLILSNDWYIARNGNPVSGYGAANVAGVTANQQYGSQILSLTAPSMAGEVLTNSQVVTSAPSNDIILFGTSGASISIDNSKFCSSSTGGSQGVFRFSGSNNNTLTLTNSLIYGRHPNSVNPTLLFNGGSGTTYLFQGDDFGSNEQYWTPISDQGSGNTFSASSMNNIYESQGGYSPQWFLNTTHYVALSNWVAAVTDPNATTDGGAAYLACKMAETMPEVQ